eukprot:gene14092-18911_t
MVRVYPVKTIKSVNQNEIKITQAVKNGIPNRFGATKFYDRSVFGFDDCVKGLGLTECCCNTCTKIPLVILSTATESVRDHHNITLRNVKEFLDGGLLEPLDDESILIYSQTTKDGVVQVGIFAALDVEDCRKNVIKRHEQTTKAADVICSEKAKNYQSSYVDPVMVMYRDDSKVATIINHIMKTEKPIQECSIDSEASNGAIAKHAVWNVQDKNDITAIQEAFESIDSVYIADGHHRTAAACRYNNANSPQKPNARKSAFYVNSARYLTALLFPASQLNVLSYNRCVKSLGDHLTVETFMDQVSESFVVTKCDASVIEESHKSVKSSLTAFADDNNSFDGSCRQESVIEEFDSLSLKQKHFNSNTQIIPHQAVMSNENRNIHSLSIDCDDWTTKESMISSVRNSQWSPSENRNNIAMYIEGSWYKLDPIDVNYDLSNPLALIDSQVLLERLLQPILQIDLPTENRMIY